MVFICSKISQLMRNQRCATPIVFPGMTHHGAYRQCAQPPTSGMQRYVFTATVFMVARFLNLLFSGIKSIESADTTEFPSLSPSPPPMPRMWAMFYPMFDFDSDYSNLTMPWTMSLLEVVEGAFLHAQGCPQVPFIMSDLGKLNHGKGDSDSNDLFPTAPS